MSALASIGLAVAKAAIPAIVQLRRSDNKRDLAGANVLESCSSQIERTVEMEEFLGEEIPPVLRQYFKESVREMRSIMTNMATLTDKGEAITQLFQAVEAALKELES